MSITDVVGRRVVEVMENSTTLARPGEGLKTEKMPIRFALNVLRDREARRRVFEMRRTFRRNRKLLAAVSLMAIKR